MLEVQKVIDIGFWGESIGSKSPELASANKPWHSVLFVKSTPSLRASFAMSVAEDIHLFRAVCAGFSCVQFTPALAEGLTAM